jgi:hypothetical protein
VPEVDITMSSSPELVRKEDTATISWQIVLDQSLSTTGNTDPFAMTCVLAGGADGTFEASADSSGTKETNPIQSTMITQLQCTEPVTGYTITQTTRTEMFPTSQEI